MTGPQLVRKLAAHLRSPSTQQEPFDPPNWMELFVTGRLEYDPGDVLSWDNLVGDEAGVSEDCAHMRDELRELNDELETGDLEAVDSERIKEIAFHAAGMAYAVHLDHSEILKQLVSQYEALPDHYCGDRFAARQMKRLGSAIATFSVDALRDADKYWNINREAQGMIAKKARYEWLESEPIDAESSANEVADLPDRLQKGGRAK